METGTPDTLAALYGDALDFAQNLDEELTSFHFLLSFFTTPSEVTVLLEDLRIGERQVTDAYKDLKRRYAKAGNVLAEQEGVLSAIEEHAASFLQGPDDGICPLHLLLAMLGEKRCIAYQLLEETGHLGELRLRAMNTLTNPPRRIRNRVLELLEEAALIQPGTDPRTPTRTKERTLVTAPAATDTETPPVVAEQEGRTLPDIFRQFGRDLTALAREGALDPACAREREIETILDILGRKKSNNPLLVGPAGVGKTAIVEGLACRQKDGLLSGRVIWELNLSALVAGTEYRGALEKRMVELIAEVERLKDILIVFIDEIHLLGSETHEMVANILKPALARGEFPLIGATTPDEFKRLIAPDPAMERRFTLVTIEEPAGEALQAIALAAARALSAYHRVRLDDPRFIAVAIDLSSRYISGRSQPDKVLALLDTLGSVLQRAGKQQADERDLIDFIGARSGIPAENLLVDGAHILRTLPARLDDAVKGQSFAKERVTRLLARRFVRRDPCRPIASMILAGPTGTGKTETARVLAAYFFGNERRMTVFDMSEFQEPHTAARLIGAPPGYTGYEEGGLLTEAFRRDPYQLLLFDEVDKAHPKVLSLLLHILEEGRLADSRGFTVSFAQAIVVMTTSLGSGEFVAQKLGFGDGTTSPSPERTMRARLEKALSPELVNRTDEVVVFAPFPEEELREVARHLIEKAIAVISASYGITVTVDDPVAVAASLVAALGPTERQHGARAVQRWIERHIETPVLESTARAATAVPLVIFCDAVTGAVVCRPVADAI